MHQIFIGLGGSGVKTLGHLKHLLIKSGVNMGLYDFIFVDTDSKDVNAINNQYYSLNNNSNIINIHQELITYGMVNPQSEYVRASRNPNAVTDFPRIKEWVDENAVKKFSGQPMANGASGERTEGRIGFLLRRQVFENSLNNAINNAVAFINNNLGMFNAPGGGQDNAQVMPRVPIYVLSGTDGGTGSSIFLDVMYLIQNLLHNTDHRDKFMSIAGLFMPEITMEFFSMQGHHLDETKYKPNSYAFFQEVDAFLKSGFSLADRNAFQHFSPFVIQGGDGFQFKPFHYGILFDKNTSNGNSFGAEEVYLNAAYLFYHLNKTSDTRLSNLVNLAEEIGRNSVNDPWVKSFTIAGFREFLAPKAEMKKYFETRFILEMLEHGLKGISFNEAEPDINKQGTLVKNKHDITIEKELININENYNDNLELLLRQSIKSVYDTFISTDTFKDEKTGEFKSKHIDPASVNAWVENIKEAKESLISQIKIQYDTSYRSSTLRKIKQSVLYLCDEMILDYGYQYLYDFISALDVYCEQKIISIKADKSTLETKKYVNDTCTNIEQIYDAFKGKIWTSTLGVKKTNTNVFASMISEITQYMEDRIQIALYDCFINMYNYLSNQEIGWIDNLERNLNLAKDHIEAQLTTYSDLYNNKLLKEFSNTRNMVTRQYLPPIHSFTDNGLWLPNEFSTVYENTIIRDASTQAGSMPKPVRSTAITAFSLKSVLIKVITDPAYMNNINYAAGENACNYFQQYLNPDKVNSTTTIANSIFIIVEGLRKWMNQVLFTDVDFFGNPNMISAEISKNLLTRYNQNQLMQANINNEFQAKLTTFCNTEEGQVNASFVYTGAANLVAIANNFGFINNAPLYGQFIPDDTTDSLIAVKTIDGKTFMDYRLTSNYETRYKNAKVIHPDTFTPHIHKRFNVTNVWEELGANGGNEPEQEYKIIAELILMAKIFEAIKDKDLKQLLGVDLAISSGIPASNPRIKYLNRIITINYNNSNNQVEIKYVSDKYFGTKNFGAGRIFDYIQDSGFMLTEVDKYVNELHEIKNRDYTRIKAIITKAIGLKLIDLNRIKPNVISYVTSNIHPIDDVVSNAINAEIAKIDFGK